MSAVAAGEQPLVPPPETRPIAGFWRRLAALAIDMTVLAVPTLLLGLAMFRWAASLGQAGRLIGFIVALLYFGLLNSRLGAGQTLGKRLLDIRVTDRAGQALSPPRSILRFLVIAVPYFLNGLWFDVDATSLGPRLLGVVLAFVVFGGLGAISYLFVFNRSTRQSLHDLAVGSFVVRGPGVAIPTGLTTPRLHLIIVGCWLALALIGPVAVSWLARKPDITASMKPLGELQSALKTQFGVQHVTVTRNTTTMATVRTGTSTTSYLQVEVQVAAWHDQPDAVIPMIAGSVLDRYPDLLGAQALIIQVSSGFDLGIATWSRSNREALDAAGWREKLARLHAPPGKT